MSGNFFLDEHKLIKTVRSAGIISKMLLDKESSESAISTSRAIHESSSEIQPFDTIRLSESDELNPPDTQPYTGHILSKSHLDTRYISYYQAKKALHKLFSSHCHHYFDEICQLLQEKIHLENSISSLELHSQAVKFYTGDKAEYIQKLSHLDIQDQDIDKELTKVTLEFDMGYIDTHKSLQNEQAAFSTLNELHVTIEKLHSDLLRSKIDLKGENSYKLNKIQKLKVKVSELSEEYNSTQQELSKLQMSNSLLHNKIHHTNDKEDSGRSELELIHREYELARVKLATSQNYESTLEKGVSSITGQVEQKSDSKYKGSSERKQDTICREESEMSTVKSDKESYEREMSYEGKCMTSCTDIETAEISTVNEITGLKFEELTDSRRIKQLMDELHFLVSHREKILYENQKNSKAWITDTARQQEIINTTKKIQEIQKIIRSVMLVFP